ncbi:MAG TPA: cupin domain-containing protein [Croceibacterium sp.]|jgi:mannose-6-phosphate isomerase-like protein (cupin superfamily)|nr:cupin domain-containing protein [Croceibacterium sp.]
MFRSAKLLGSAVLAIALAAAASAQEAAFNAADIAAVVAGKPEVDGPNKVMRTFVANRSQLQVLTITNIKLHHHALEDHIVYVAKGAGNGRFEVAPGKIESRPVKVGDIFVLPKNLRHAFEKTGGEDLVLLVVATVGWKPLEDTKFHE